MSIKPFNVANLSKVNLMDPKDVGYQDSIDIIYDELQKTRKSFIKIGWYLKHIKDAAMYKEDGYTNIYEFAYDKFNISQSTATRFINLCIEFSVNHDSPDLDEKYIDFSVSQLFEMLPMKSEEKGKITPDMTVRQIREVKNETKEKINEMDDEEKEIPGQTSIEEDFPEYMPDSEQFSPEQEKKSVTLHDNQGKEDQDSLDSKEQVIDGEYRDVPEVATFTEDYQPEFPILRNNDQRKEWLKNYKKWGIWYRDENIDVNYYKFDFSDGSRLVVAEHPQRYNYWNGKRSDECFYHLLEKNKKCYHGTYDEKYRHSTDSETYLVEFLKNLQKKG